MNAYQEGVYKIFAEYMSKIERKEKTEMLYLANKWGVLEKKLEEQILKLAEAQPLTRNQLYRMDSYQEFLVVSKREVDKFHNFAAEEISRHQEQFIQYGIEAAQKSLQSSLYKINPEAVKTMIGFTREGTPLYQLLKASYPDTVTKLTNTLIESTALGRNPIVTARLMKDDMQGNLKRALTIARTEQIGSFRETNRLQMLNSGIKNWIWLAEDDSCDFCKANADKSFPLDEPMITHPNCRCTNIPDV